MSTQHLAVTTTEAEWRKALKQDEADLKKYEGYVRTLEKGGEVENLTLPNAKKTVKGLKAVIKNKKEMLGWMAEDAKAGKKASLPPTDERGRTAMNKELRTILDELKPEGLSDAEAIKRLKGLQREIDREIKNRKKKASESGLRGEVIRLAHANPELRPHLLPLVRQGAGVNARVATAGTYLVVFDPKTMQGVAVEGPFSENAAKAQTGRVKKKHQGKEVFKLHPGVNPKEDPFLKQVKGLDRLLPRKLAAGTKPGSPDEQAKMYAKGYRYMIQWSPKSKMKNKDPLYVKSPDQAAKLVREDFPEEKDWKAIKLDKPAS